MPHRTDAAGHIATGVSAVGVEQSGKPCKTAELSELIDIPFWYNHTRVRPRNRVFV